MLPPSKEYAKILRTREKGISPLASKQDAKDFKEAVNFEKEYINTPKFAERVRKAGYDVKDYKKLQSKKLNGLVLNTDDTPFNKSGAYYLESNFLGIPLSRSVNVPSAIRRKTTNIPKGISVLTHEVGHSFDNDKLTPFINKRNVLYPKTEEEIKNVETLRKKNPNFYTSTYLGHELEAVEVTADVHAARKELYDYTNKKGKKLYDGRYSNFTEDAYNNMQEIAAKDFRSASSRLINKIGRKKTPAEKRVWNNVDDIDTEEKQIEYDKKTDAIQDSLDKDTKQYIFDIMNRVVDNKKPKPSQYMAMGGLIRPSSRKRHIAPLVIGAISAVGSIVGGISASAKARKAKEEARMASLKQEQDALRASYAQQAQADAQALANFEEEGQEGVQYYKKGGEIADNSLSVPKSFVNPYSRQGGGLKPNLPVSNGGYQTKGGNLVPIGDGVELAVGNRHNDTSIDGVSGIQLSQNGDTVAEIEHDEVIADGNVVYSDRLKYDKKRSYADVMKALTKKRNKLEQEQSEASNKAKMNSLDRKLAGLNMAEETLFKTQELHKEMEGRQVINNTFAYGGRTPGRPLPVPKWAQTFLTKQKGGKYDGYGTNGLGDYRDPNNPNVVVSQNGMPKYPYEETLKPFTPKMLTTPIDKSAGMSNGSSELLSGITSATNSLVNSLDKSSSDPIVTTPSSVVDATSTTAKPKSTVDWGKVIGVAGSLAPKLIDNFVNRAQTRNAPQLPTLLHATATPLETRVNINPALAEVRRRTATLRRSVLDNTSNSNNAKSNMVATSLMSGRQADELLVGKENQEMALRNADAQNRQAVTNANTAQDNERAMMEFQRQNDLNTLRSANAANLVGDITSTINEFKIGQQFDADVKANLLDDPMGSKSILYAQDPEFMSNKTNKDFIFKLAKTRKNPVLVKYLKDNYNYTD